MADERRDRKWAIEKMKRVVERTNDDEAKEVLDYLLDLDKPIKINEEFMDWDNDE